MLEGCSPYPDEFSARYVREGYWSDETIQQAIAESAQRIMRANPHAIAVSDSSRALTFSQLVSEAASTAALLERSGIRRGDRIIVQLPNCVEFASLFLGSLEIGAIPVMTLPAFRRAELEYLASFSKAKAIAIAPTVRGFDHAALARELRSQLASLETIFTIESARDCVSLREEIGGAPSLGSRRGDPFDAALFLLSGGTTGMPKLIPRTHADYLYNARASVRACGLSANSRLLLALPVEHNFPLACPGLLGAMLIGARAVLCAATQPAELSRTIDEQQITHFPCVPTLAIGLAALPPESRHALRSLRVITVGGQRLQEPTARELMRLYPDLHVQQVFGMAEGLICMTSPDDSDEVASCTQGRPLSPADEIRIVDALGEDVAPGAMGELCCRGPYTIRGYWNAAERNREAFTDNGFYRTGDLVRMHPSANLVVEGRVKDLINRGGEKISAEEVEAHLLAHPAVRAVAVVSMPDPTLGERACAFITIEIDAEQPSLEDIRELLSARGVARFKWPERLEIVAELPLTNVGKIQKAELRRLIAERLGAETASQAERAAR
ncbi:MAG TPA: AMP-binding protein [Candidatus Binataceae bacterium]|nr:AMP-binding protein [Candidatus Binataceae bacterium]